MKLLTIISLAKSAEIQVNDSFSSDTKNLKILNKTFESREIDTQICIQDNNNFGIKKRLLELVSSGMGTEIEVSEINLKDFKTIKISNIYIRDIEKILYYVRSKKAEPNINSPTESFIEQNKKYRKMSSINERPFIKVELSYGKKSFVTQEEIYYQFRDFGKSFEFSINENSDPFLYVNLWLDENYYEFGGTAIIDITKSYDFGRCESWFDLITIIDGAKIYSGQVHIKYRLTK